jgi:hypothetical protein
VERDPSGWTDLDVDRLEELKGEDFESFCFALLQCEAYHRHDGPVFDGPAGESVPDGGRDILLTIRKPPVTTKRDYQQQHLLAPLTEDDFGQTAYSCKSGHDWLNQALRDVEERKAPGRAVEVLQGGGHFKLFINCVGKLDASVVRGRDRQRRTPQAHLASAFWERMKEVDPNAGDPAHQIEILDAHAIVSFLKARRPAGGAIAGWAERLRLTPLLHGIEEWADEHRADRGDPVFTSDPARTSMKGDLLEFLRAPPTDERARAGWLVGPPGVGKTRLLLETFRDPSITQRVLIAWNADEALTALAERRLATRHPGVVLVVDDCPAGEVDEVAERFLRTTKDDPAARLIVVTPASDRAREKPKLVRRWFLPPLEPSAAEALAGRILGERAGREQTEEVAKLSEGYPWFTALLAREALGEGRSPQSLREAMFWALAAPAEARAGLELDNLRRRRGRCLVAATLTSSMDWAHLPPEELESIAQAVGLGRWSEVVDGAEECFKRGILRRNLGWLYKYVTPFVLERELLVWFFEPEGPDPGGRGLTRLAGRYRAELYDALERLGLPPGAVDSLADAGLARLSSLPADLTSLVSSGILGPELRFLARHAPGATAREIRRRIAAASLDELRVEVRGRRDLVFALEELVTRRDAFEDAEAALFKLAQAENESWANNATATWSSIFLIDLNATHSSLDDRIGLLEHRSSDPDAPARRIALGGIKAVITTWATRTTIDPFDGIWPPPSPSDARRARIKAWCLLTARFTDADPQVASRAKQIAFEELRGAVRLGIGAEALDSITSRVATLDDEDRVKLREALANVRVYEAATLDPAASSALQHVETLVAPVSYGERLHQHVGAFGSARLRSESRERDIDEALADEGLAGDRPILAELDWLVSDRAKRSHIFAYALGRRDKEGILLGGLHRQAKSWRQRWRARIVFARYLGGWAEANRAAEADAVLRDLQADLDEAPIAALVLIELGATDEHLAWLRRALSADRVDPAAVMELSRRRDWLANAGESAFRSFVTTLLEGVDVHHAAAAIELLMCRIKEDPGRAASLSELVLRGLERLAPERLDGMTDHYWELGAKLLVRQGNTCRVAELAIIALSRDAGSPGHAWSALHAAAEGDPGAAWRAVAAALEGRDDASAERLLMKFRFHRTPFQFPAEDVLTWVGNDKRRGRMVASVVRIGTDDLNPILRALLQRFGARGSVANEIAARIHSTDGLVASLAEHDARQLRRARSWQSDPDPRVLDFSRRLVESLERSYEQHSAQEDDERRRFGT